jgi:pyridoxine kinase
MDPDYAPPDGSRILSIQSSTVHGYVGNKSAVFPLQLLGFDVDPVHSVQFSNHTGYASFAGDVMNGTQLEALVDGLDKNGLLGCSASSGSGDGDGDGDGAAAAAAAAAATPGAHVGYTHLLTGYVGSITFLRAVAATAARLRANSPALRWVCDPVMGDGGKLYVPEELIAVYAEEIVPHAAVLTPNQFEAQLLSGVTIEGMADALHACAVLHAKGPELVVLTSLDFVAPEEEARGGAEAAARAALGPEAAQAVLAGGSITMLASRRRGGGGGGGGGAGVLLEQYRMSFPRIHGHYTGTGDLTAALLLAYSSRFPDDLPMALRCAGASMQAVLLRTLRDAVPDAAAAAAGAAGLPSIGGCVGELRLIQSRRAIEVPPLDGVPLPRSDGLRMPPLVVERVEAGPTAAE